MKLIGYALALALLASPVAAQDVIEGKALALDGDTLVVTQADGKAVTVRLWGVDAPEMKVWPWGPVARGALDRILSYTAGQVRCERKGKSHNRIVAQCFHKAEAVGRDIATTLIRNGLAVEWRSFSKGHYSADEDWARTNGRGVWKSIESLKLD